MRWVLKFEGELKGDFVRAEGVVKEVLDFAKKTRMENIVVKLVETDHKED